MWFLQTPPWGRVSRLSRVCLPKPKHAKYLGCLLKPSYASRSHVWKQRLHCINRWERNWNSATNNPSEKHILLFWEQPTSHGEMPVNTWLIDTTAASDVHKAYSTVQSSLQGGKPQHYFYPVSTSKASPLRTCRLGARDSITVSLMFGLLKPLSEALGRKGGSEKASKPSLSLTLSLSLSLCFSLPLSVFLFVSFSITPPTHFFYKRDLTPSLQVKPTALVTGNFRPKGDVWGVYLVWV